MDKTLHIGTQGYYAPPGNMGSNPLVIGSHYRLGPDAGIFGLQLTPNVRQVLNFNDLFTGSLNPFEIELTNADLEVVSGHNGDVQNVFDMRIRIGGISYKVPISFAKKIAGKLGERIFWRSTRHPGEADHDGSFRFFRNSPGVF